MYRSIFTLLAVTLCLTSFSVLAQTKVVFADSPYPPYVLGSPQDKVPQGGTAVDLVHQLFNQFPDYTVEFSLKPWKRVLRELEDGSVDGVTMVAQTPERASFLDFSAALIDYQLALFYSTSTFPNGFEWQRLADLSRYQIGVVEGYLSDSKLHELVAQGAPLSLVRLAGTETQLFGMLLRGRIDLVCFKLESGNTLIRSQQWIDDIAASSNAIYKGSYHLGFSKARQHQDLIMKLNPIIESWRSSGKLDAILHPHSPL